MDKVKRLLIVYCEDCMRWLSPSWYQYLFSRADDPKYTSWRKRLLCRIRKHPNGCWFYNPKIARAIVSYLKKEREVYVTILMVVFVATTNTEAR